MINKITGCFRKGGLYYSSHARSEMELEELGQIYEDEVYEAVISGKVVEDYPGDSPYPSCLIYGRTARNRPLHIVCAFAEEEDLAVIVTVYEPNPELWIDFSRRRK